MQQRILTVLLALFAGLALASAAARAQVCRADSDCAPYGQNRHARCDGSTLVTRDRLCLGGHCSDSVTRRIECGGIGTLGNCDPIAGQCRGTAGGVSVSNACPPRCLCRGTTLIVVTGKRGTTKRCETEVRECGQGCACSPAPHCKAAEKKR